MDKRWILIIIIIIIAAGCGYLVAQSSPNVGNAIAGVNKSIVTLPHGFSVGSSEGAYLELINKHSDEKIYIEDKGSGDNSEIDFEKNLKKISETSDKQIIDNFSDITPNGIKVYIAHYINEETSKNESISYYFTFGHTYYMKLSGFEDVNQENEKIKLIADTTETDFKKAQNPEDNPKSDSAVKYERKVKGQ